MMYWWGEHMNGWGCGRVVHQLASVLGLVIAGVVAVVRLAEARAPTADLWGSKTL